MEKLQLAITIVAITAKIAISAISAMAMEIYNIVILGIQLRSIKNSSVVSNSYKFDLLFKRYSYFCDFSIFTPYFLCKMLFFEVHFEEKMVHARTQNF